MTQHVMREIAQFKVAMDAMVLRWDITLKRADGMAQRFYLLDESGQVNPALLESNPGIREAARAYLLAVAEANGYPSTSENISTIALELPRSIAHVRFT